MLLSAPDSLVVSITKNIVESDGEASTSGSVLGTRKSRVNNLGMNGLDMLKFTYKVILQSIYFPFYLTLIY